MKHTAMESVGAAEEEGNVLTSERGKERAKFTHTKQGAEESEKEKGVHCAECGICLPADHRGGRAEGDCGSRGTTKQTLQRNRGVKEKRKRRDDRKHTGAPEAHCGTPQPSAEGEAGGQGSPRARGRPGRAAPRLAGRPGRAAAGRRAHGGGEEVTRDAWDSGGGSMSSATCLPPVSPPSLAHSPSAWLSGSKPVHSEAS